MDYFKKFIIEEYEWVFDFGTDTSSMLLEEFKDNITEEEFENNFEVFKTEATNLYVNDEYYIQQLHEQMDDCFRTVLTEYIENKDEYLNSKKVSDNDIKCQIKNEVKEAYKTLKRYENSKEILKEVIDEDKSTCPDWLKDLVK